MNYFEDQLETLKGAKIVESTFDDNDEETYYGLVLLKPDGSEVVLWFLRDEEDNGPGSFEIAELTAYAKLDKFGCWVKTVTVSGRRILLSSPIIEKTGVPESEWGEVTAPQKEFLDVVNARLQTSFTLDQFSGR